MINYSENSAHLCVLSAKLYVSRTYNWIKLYQDIVYEKTLA